MQKAWKKFKELSIKIQGFLVVKGWKIRPFFQILKPKENDIGYFPHANKNGKEQETKRG